MSAPRKRWRVTVLQWRSHHATVEATDEVTAETIARDLWEAQGEEGFSFADGGSDGVVVEEVLP